MGNFTKPLLLPVGVPAGGAKICEYLAWFSLDLMGAIKSPGGGEKVREAKSSQVNEGEDSHVTGGRGPVWILWSCQVKLEKKFEVCNDEMWRWRRNVKLETRKYEVRERNVKL